MQSNAHIFSQDSYSQIQSASTKKDAIGLAIVAAENLLKAVKISSDPEDQTRMKAQFSATMDLADKIKSSREWPPLAPLGQNSLSSLTLLQQPLQSSNANVTSWAAGLSQAGTYSENALQSTASPASGGLGVSNLASPSPVPSAFTLPLPLHDFNKTSRESSSAKNFQNQGDTSAPAPSMASYSHIRKLVEPVSTRQRSKKEEIILLKASLVNGFKCPPWDKPPTSSDFAADQNGLFV